MDALGKPPDFDAQTDPSVRVLALRLRKTLAACYEEQQDCRARIVLSVGTYVPLFLKASPVERPDSEPQVAGSTAVIDSSGGQTGGGKDSTGIVTVVPGALQSANENADSLASDKRDSKSKSVIGFGTSNALLTGIFLLAAILMLVVTGVKRNATDSDQQQLTQADSESQSGILATTDSASSALAPAGTRPVVYVSVLDQTDPWTRLVSMSMSQTLALAGTVDVIHHSDIVDVGYSPGDYQLLVSSMFMEESIHLDTQIVNLLDGLVLFADSTQLFAAADQLTADSLQQLQEVSANMAALQGAIYQDFCSKYADVETAISGCVTN